ncbi:MAG TPA: TIGR03009 domain-containing protein [Gemmataceae bacterium]|nr:TIGR03009 domain-containing protein [Gemmataceae bacterium]
MRSYGLVLAALLQASLTVSAQQAQQAPATPPAAPADDKALDGYLQKWEGAMKDVTSLGAQLVRIDKDRTFNTVQKLAGEAWYMKAGSGATALNLALLEMRLEGRDKKEIKEKFICTGTYIYQFLPDQKEIRYYEMPKPKQGQVAEDNLLSLLFGMKAEDAKRRYSLKMAKEDQYYIYVDIAPRSSADKSDFQRARLVLNKTNFLPRQLWFEHANGNEVMWDIPNVQLNMKLDRHIFDAPKAPEGWKTVAGETKPQPRTVRPSAPPSK